MTTHRSLRTACLAALVQLCSLAAEAAQQSPVILDRPLRVFIDCRGRGCDEEFFRAELHWIDHVRDQQDADVHLLVTAQETGGGGHEYTIRVLGRGGWDGREDVLRAATEAGEADDTIRRKLAQVFALALARYAANTLVGPSLKGVPPERTGPTATQTTAARDPWNFWVFRVELNGFTNGEASSRFLALNVNTSANRITEAWKVNFNAGVNYSQNRFN